jgi:hypothetical protein
LGTSLLSFHLYHLYRRLHVPLLPRHPSQPRLVLHRYCHCSLRELTLRGESKQDRPLPTSPKSVPICLSPKTRDRYKLPDLFASYSTQLDCMLSPLECNSLGTPDSTSFLGILPIIVRRVRVGVRMPVFLYTSPMIIALSDKDQCSLRAQAASDNNYAHVSHVCSNAHDEPEHASSVKSSPLLTLHTKITDLTAPARGSSLHSID